MLTSCLKSTLSITNNITTTFSVYLWEWLTRTCNSPFPYFFSFHLFVFIHTAVLPEYEFSTGCMNFLHKAEGTSDQIQQTPGSLNGPPDSQDINSPPRWRTANKKSHLFLGSANGDETSASGSKMWSSSFWFFSYILFLSVSALLLSTCGKS